MSHITLERFANTINPGIDIIIVHLRRSEQFDNLVHGHTISQHTRNQLGVIPEHAIKTL